jgi:hypothetical protein
VGGERGAGEGRAFGRLPAPPDRSSTLPPVPPITVAPRAAATDAGTVPLAASGRPDAG